MLSMLYFGAHANATFPLRGKGTKHQLNHILTVLEAFVSSPMALVASS